LEGIDVAPGRESGGEVKGPGVRPINSDNHKDDDRVEWLFEGLSHKEPRIRASSEDELRKLTGEYFGYHYDLPRRERDQARTRWQRWWKDSGRAGKKT